jgi:hypothetical protein
MTISKRPIAKKIGGRVAGLVFKIGKSFIEGVIFLPEQTDWGFCVPLETD